ncbi:hypothetical protein RHMOL_Rhmol01G0104400 [Rhododendron molle]|uniref:Uncharacterized protein n=1 Tax=Rhododendron molle TaxID=49168 RepID=A0ACC0Q1H7_RHOML|nr:hypothetical protein RHMOL_Rhmol01G0104400 [Rhododendron molle]
MENFAQQDLLDIRISDNEFPFPNPRNPFVQAGASATDFGEIPPSFPFTYPSAFPDPFDQPGSSFTDLGEVPHAPFPNPFDPAGAASTDSLCSKSSIDGGVDQLEESCRFFPLSTILKATNDFDDALVVGTGGFGKVYKAIIDDGTVVAIKRLNAESNQGAEEFWTEVKLLSKLRHAHLVSLVGYCNEHQEMILVYEYMVNGTLASHLYKSSRDESGESISPLKWAQRLNICLGAARGLDCLHIGTKQPIIHRDVKTTNILLDENWVAKVSDFGICKLITSQTTTHVSTKVKATRGYWDPDYFYTDRVTRKSDVYAFGVVLLEVLCGRPPLDHRLEEDQISLILWVKDHIENGKLDRIIDPSLKGELTPQSLKYFSKLANNCLRTKPKERPTMSEVVEMLQNALTLHERKGISWGTITKAFQGIKLVPMGMNRCRREGNGNGSNNFSKSLLKEHSNVDVFTYKEMRLAIKHFRPDEVLCKGGFGVVYKGVLDESVRKGYKTTNVAIKGLSPKGFQGENMLLAEVSYLGQLSHPNLVKLIGYCFEDKHRLLVYEYMASGSLDMHLFQRDCATLTWSRRMKIALDAARGLAFLHLAERPIIHRDFKTSNVLLDADFNAKLSGFGLARDGPMGDQTHVSTRVMGTFGYMAPEYAMTGLLTTRNDVYGFGVVLLEMLSGRKVSDASLPGEEVYLVDWALPHIHNKKLQRILDPRVEGQYSTRTALKLQKLHLRDTRLEVKVNRRSKSERDAAGVSARVFRRMEGARVSLRKSGIFKVVLRILDKMRKLVDALLVMKPYGLTRATRLSHSPNRIVQATTVFLKKLFKCLDQNRLLIRRELVSDMGNGSLTSSTKANSTSPENSSTLESHEFESGGITAATPENVGDLCLNPGCGNVDVFTYEGMRLATMPFQPAIVLGEGGFGIVYKGVIGQRKEGGGFEVWEWQSALGKMGKQQHSFYALLDSLCILDIGTFLVRCGVGGSIRGDGTSPFVGRGDSCQEA